MEADSGSPGDVSIQACRVPDAIMDT